MTRRLVVAALAAAACFPAIALASFPQDAPNDPDFAAAEHNCSNTSVNDEQYNLYSTNSACTPNAHPPDGSAGMSVDSVWKQSTTGDPNVTIAYVEGGINWNDPDARDLVNQVYLNAGELPKPTTPVDDGRLNVKDYADTKDYNGNGYVDPEDLIVRFSDHRDNDHNGYTDDISGWDFYDHQNDPATYDSTYGHANNQQRRAAAEGNNGFRGIGVCPGCTILPVKAGAEALDRTDDLAQAWEFAADSGASVVVSVTADLGYSSFMTDVVEDLNRRGVVMVEASNDFDSTDHQGGHYHPHVIPGNGMVSNTAGLNATADVSNLLTTSFTERAGPTSWGTKNFVTASTQGGTTSETTPTHGGLYALLLSVGRKAAADGRLKGGPLSGPEMLQVVRATATDINSPDTNWPSAPGFDLQYGYGRPNALRAMQAINSGGIPPVGWISSPDWYALFDPTKQASVPVTGHVEAPRSNGYRWSLQVAPGPQPTDAEFVDAGSGAGNKPFDGRLGTVDLSKLPPGFAEKAFALSKTRTLETNETYTVTLRLRVTDAQGRVGEDRRTIAVQHDPTAVKGFPLFVGRHRQHGAEAQPQLADLQGRGHLALIFGDGDGRVHAIDGVTAKELPGWPAYTNATKVVRKHAHVHPGHEPILANAAVGDLRGDGYLDVVVATTTGRVYAFDRHGKRLKGWPRKLNAGVVTPPIPRPKLSFTRLPHMGSTAAPVLVDLNSDHRLDVVQAGWDGRLHAWNADGSNARGWPVEVKVPTGPPAGFARLNDHKLVSPPAVADLDGDGKPEIVERTQYMDILGADIQPLANAYTFAYHADGKPVARWPVKQGAVFAYYGSAQEFITEGANAPAAADVDRTGKDEVATGPIFSPTYLYDGAGKQKAGYGLVPDLTLGLLRNPDPSKLLATGLPADAPLSFTASGGFGDFEGHGLSYAEPGTGGASIVAALETAGLGLPITNVMRLHDARNANNLQGFPVKSQGLDFLGGPTFADVTGDGKAELLQGGDSSALAAYRSNALQAGGFPKFTTGWTVYSPAVGDLDGDGKVEVVTMTREGYLMAWHTPGLAAANTQWWSFRHDEHNSANYGTDARPPGVARNLVLASDGSNVTFTAPGDDWYSGRAHEVTVWAYFTPSGRPSSVRTVALHAAAGERVKVDLPAGTLRAEVQVTDEAGNHGTPARVTKAHIVCRSARSRPPC